MSFNPEQTSSELQGEGIGQSITAGDEFGQAVRRRERREQIQREIADSAGAGYSEADVTFREGEAGRVRGELSTDAVRRELAEDILQDTDRFNRGDIVYERVDGDLQARISPDARRREAAEDLSDDLGREIESADVELTDESARLADEVRRQIGLEDLQGTTEISLTGEDLVLEEGSVQLSEAAQRQESIQQAAQESDRFDVSDFTIQQEDGDEVIAPTDAALERERQDIREEVFPQLQEETQTDISPDDVLFSDEGVTLDPEVRQQEALPALQEQTETEISEGDIQLTDEGVTLTEGAQREEAVESLQTRTSIPLTIQNIEIQDGQAQLTSRAQEEIAASEIRSDLRQEFGGSTRRDLIGPGDITQTDSGYELAESGIEAAQEYATEQAIRDLDAQTSGVNVGRADVNITDEGISLDQETQLQVANLSRSPDDPLTQDEVVFDEGQIDPVGTQEQMVAQDLSETYGVDVGREDIQRRPADSVIGGAVGREIAGEELVPDVETQAQIDEISTPQTDVGEISPTVAGGLSGAVTSELAFDVTTQLTEQEQREQAAAQIESQIEQSPQERFREQVREADGPFSGAQADRFAEGAVVDTASPDVDLGAEDITTREGQLVLDDQARGRVGSSLDEFAQQQARESAATQLEFDLGRFGGDIDPSDITQEGEQFQLDTEARQRIQENIQTARDARIEARNRQAIRQISRARPATSEFREEQLREDVAGRVTEETGRDITTEQIEFEREDGAITGATAAVEQESGDGGDALSGVVSGVEDVTGVDVPGEGSVLGRYDVSDFRGGVEDVTGADIPTQADVTGGIEDYIEEPIEDTTGVDIPDRTGFYGGARDVAGDVYSGTRDAFSGAADTTAEGLSRIPTPSSGDAAALATTAVAVPEPTTSATGTLVLGGIAATAGAAAIADELGTFDTSRRQPTQDQAELPVEAPDETGELAIGDPIQEETELDVTQSESDAEVSIQPGEPVFPSELDVTEGTGVTELPFGDTTGGEGTTVPGDESVVPGDYPLGGRDIPADPTRDYVPGASIDLTAMASPVIGEETTEETEEEDVITGEEIVEPEDETSEIARQVQEQTLYEQEERYGEVERESLIERAEEQQTPVEELEDPDITSEQFQQQQQAFEQQIEDLTPFQRRQLRGRMGTDAGELQEAAQQPEVTQEETVELWDTTPEEDVAQDPQERIEAAQRTQVFEDSESTLGQATGSDLPFPEVIGGEVDQERAAERAMALEAAQERSFDSARPDVWERGETRERVDTRERLDQRQDLTEEVTQDFTTTQTTQPPATQTTPDLYNLQQPSQTIPEYSPETAVETPTENPPENPNLTEFRYPEAATSVLSAESRGLRRPRSPDLNFGLTGVDEPEERRRAEDAILTSFFDPLTGGVIETDADPDDESVIPGS